MDNENMATYFNEELEKLHEKLQVQIDNCNANIENLNLMVEILRWEHMADKCKWRIPRDVNNTEYACIYQFARTGPDIYGDCNRDNCPFWKE